eukprot:c4518_g1_i1.p1 GENE.c4518_g1_i1~~c4518_g1_i1.p1  ORF type:complete len:238 (+),score=10.23 c4518_g1_i1:37-750(+)
MHDSAVFGFGLFVCLAVVEVLKFLVRRKVLGSSDARKSLHILTGPIFLLVWPLFEPSSTTAHLWAALIPTLVTLQFALIGLGLWRDADTVKTMSRSGHRRELLGGPLQYGVVCTLATIFWFRSTIGIMSIIILCIGDGFADVLGRRFGHLLGGRVPWNAEKSIFGSVSFVMTSIIGSAVYCFAARSLGWTEDDESLLMIKIVCSCTLAGVIESLPSNGCDNITVFCTVIFTNKFLII